MNKIRFVYGREKVDSFGYLCVFGMGWRENGKKNGAMVREGRVSGVNGRNNSG